MISMFSNSNVFQPLVKAMLNVMQVQIENCKGEWCFLSPLHSQYQNFNE